jgi:uncharacterized repeat protein (TIGR04076 family)
MGQGGLTPWLGRSRQRFLKRLRGPRIPVRCVSKKVCEAQKTGQITLGDWAIPLRHTKPIELCTHALSGIGQYVVALAHEIGHMSWGNADKRDCQERCIRPRLSNALTLAAYHAWHGTGHDPSQCPVLCGVIPEPQLDGGELGQSADGGLESTDMGVNSARGTDSEAAGSP